MGEVETVGDASVGPSVTRHDVVVVGAGPTGLMLAAELALAGTDVVVVERRTSQFVDGSRAGGLHARTLEVLDQRSVGDRFVRAGQLYPFLGYGQMQLDMSDMPSRHAHVLGLWQSEFEPILAAWVDELGVPILRGCEVVEVEPDGDGVDVLIATGMRLRAGWLVGCDGGRSPVRKAAGIGFTGLDPETSWMIAEVEMDGDPEVGFRHDADGSHGLGRRADDDPVRVVITEPTTEHTGEPDLEDLRAAIVRVWGRDFGLRRASWISRFTDMARQATAYRAGRILVAGDAAHVHPPQGGQGLNTGVQDAVNLGWKLALVVAGAAPESLLDSYHDERHPVAARVLDNTMAQVALATPGPRHQALRDHVARLMAMDEPRRSVVAMVSALDVHYDLGEGHPLLGRRVPDLDLTTAEGPTTVFALLHEARPVLLDLVGSRPAPGTAPTVDVGPWADRVRVVVAACDGPWVLPLLGEVEAPRALLVRPDGHVAWVGHPGDPALPVTLERWFGPAPTS